MARILVTGGAGFIGSHIAAALVADGNQVVILDNFSTGHESNLEEIAGQITVERGDLRDMDAVRRATAGCDYVFHEGALASVPRSVKDPESSNAVNVGGTLNVLQAARDAGVKRVVYAGSSSAYGNTEVSPKHEGLTPQPLSPYAVSKLAGEHYCRAFSAVYGLETLSIRYFNVFGPRQDPDSPYAAVLPIFTKELLAGRSPRIDGDGAQTRDFTYVANVVEGNLRAIAAPKTAGESVNVACGGSYSVRYLFDQIRDQLGVDLEPEFGPRRAGDVDHSQADIALAGELIGYAPVVSFEEGLRRTVDWYRATATAGGR
ncbi:MAG: SDR family oxidoreductase [Candidatus Krumholzibacteriia bacterium]|nr:SDR family oxidoreductase [bacterium]MCB9515110.1 SDR family oxidoreductase [Candidatus Latescibacterota bacterium]